MTDTRTKTVSILGGTGFVGQAIVQAFLQKGWSVRTIPAPRLIFTGEIPESVLPTELFSSEILRLSEQLKSSVAIVNAAGDPNASSQNLTSVLGPNAALPIIVKRAAEMAKVARYVHISSSVVQGDRAVLDSTTNLLPFSPYSKAKALGEKWLLKEPSVVTTTTIFRPPSVHAVGREVTEKIRTLAASPLSSVAGTGSSQTPQALLENVADAVTFLVASPEQPPLIVHHPWEGLTSIELLRFLGNREPRHVPKGLARALIKAVKVTERSVKLIAPNRRRLELLWFGQSVAPSWLEQAGWLAPLGKEKWIELGQSPI
jgi:nucleoside-diphosphate-sugar epimerase